MAGADRHVPKYRHYKPKDLAVVRIDGRDHYLGKYDSPESWEKYHRLLAEHAATGSMSLAARQGGKEPSDELTLNELILLYWRHVQAYYVKDGKPTTEVCVIRQVLKVVRELYGHTLAKDFGPLSMKACQDAMVGRGWSRKSINRQAIRIRAMFKWGAGRELLPSALYEALRTVGGLRRGRSAAKENPPVAPVADEVIQKTLAHMPPTPAALVLVQRLSGMRPQEVVGLRAIDLDMSDPTCWIYRPARHKREHDDRERMVFLGSRAIEVIRPFLGLDLTTYLFSPRRSEAERNARRHVERKTPVYRSPVAHQAENKKASSRRPLGDRYTVGTYRQAIHRACDRAFRHPAVAKLADKNLDPTQRAELEAWCKAHQAELEVWRKSRRWNPHALRHAAGTQIRGRFGLEAAQAVLGHSELRTTQIYGQKNLEAARRVMREIG
jgi:integrase